MSRIAAEDTLDWEELRSEFDSVAAEDDDGDKKDVSFEEEDGISAPLIDLSHNGLLSPLP